VVAKKLLIAMPVKTAGNEETVIRRVKKLNTESLGRLMAGEKAK